ncbi:hypothetical protein FGB62_21g447 [Gracilaria domingensis]|nr:hypothetical protein FGB62_21g447 [Gracilaria domingensis]
MAKLQAFRDQPSTPKPKVTRARRRRNNRPRVRNQSRGNLGLDFKSVDPLPNDNSIPQKFHSNPVGDHVGEIELRSSLPVDIGHATSEFFYSFTQQYSLAEKVARDTSDDIIAQTFFKSAKQLFSSLNESQKSNCRPLNVSFMTPPRFLHASRNLSL